MSYGGRFSIKPPQFCQGLFLLPVETAYKQLNTVCLVGNSWGKMQQLVAEDGCEMCVFVEKSRKTPDKVTAGQRSDRRKGTNETG